MLTRALPVIMCQPTPTVKYIHWRFGK